MSRGGVPGRAWTVADMAFVADNFRTMTVAEIAEKLGRTEYSVKFHMSNMGMTRRRLKDHDTEIRQLAKQGLKAYQIADELGVARSSMLRYVAAHHIRILDKD